MKLATLMADGAATALFRLNSRHAAVRERVSTKARWHGFGWSCMFASVVIGLAAAAIMTGAVMIANSDAADHEVTGSVMTRSASDDSDHYVEMFARGPGSGWYVLHRTSSAPNRTGDRAARP